jgi:hypothetical protein
MVHHLSAITTLKGLNGKYIFLHIVMKVALFYTKNRSESSTFLHNFIPYPGDDCQSIPTYFFFFTIFHKSF